MAFLQVPWEQNFYLGTTDLLHKGHFSCKCEWVIVLNKELLPTAGTSPPAENSSGEGNLWTKQGVVCTSASRQPGSSLCLRLPVALEWKETLQSWREEKHHKENEWEGRGLMHNAALHEWKKGRRITQGCCVCTPIWLTYPEHSDCSTCNSPQASKQSKLEENDPCFMFCCSLYPYCR